MQEAPGSSQTAPAMTLVPAPITWTRHAKDPYQLQLFHQPGFKPAMPSEINRMGLIWQIEPSMTEKPYVAAADLHIKIMNIPLNTYVYTRFSLQQPSNVRHQFEHVFDFHRASFVYRCALTIPKVRTSDGMVSHQYSYYRFLRSRDDDEDFEFHVEPGEAPPNPKVPYIWDQRAELPVPVDMNGKLENYNVQLEQGLKTFLYSFAIEFQQTLHTPVPLNNICWPKATRTGTFVGGRTFSVDTRWFCNEWPSVDHFMDNLDILSKSDAELMIDAMGYYYHVWPMPNERMVKLTKTAEKFGFYDLPHIPILTGIFDCFTNSLRSVYILHDTHPLLTNQLVIRETLKPETVFFKCSALFNSMGTEAEPDRHMFKLSNGMTWTISLSRAKYMNVEYLAVNFLINGKFKRNEHSCWKIEISPDVDKPKFLKKQTHFRVINTVQRSIGFPTCYRLQDVDKEMGDAPYSFKLTFSKIPIRDWKVDVVPGGHPATGVINGKIISMDRVEIPVNLDFLAAQCTGYRNFYDDPIFAPGKNAKDIILFLDHLYHGSKLYDDDTWLTSLSVAWEFGSVFVLDSLERAAIRSGKTPEYYPRKYDELSYELLKFHHYYRNVFGMTTLDEFLERLTGPTFEYSSKPDSKVCKHPK